VAAVNDVRVVFDYALTTSLSSSSPPSFNSKVSKRNLNNACHWRYSNADSWWKNCTQAQAIYRIRQSAETWTTHCLYTQ